MNTTTGAQRHNNKLHKIFEDAKVLKRIRQMEKFESMFPTNYDVFDPLGTRYYAVPLFIEDKNMEQSLMTSEIILGEEKVKFMYREFSPMWQTKSYVVKYKIIEL